MVVQAVGGQRLTATGKPAEAIDVITEAVKLEARSEGWSRCSTGQAPRPPRDLDIRSTSSTEPTDRMPPYKFKDIVAGLLKAMDYDVLWIAPPGARG